jgi:hypothetical protein
LKNNKNIVGDNNSKDTGNMTNNVSNGPKDAPEIPSFEDGTHGIKMKGVPTNVQHMKGIGLKLFKKWKQEKKLYPRRRKF